MPAIYIYQEMPSLLITRRQFYYIRDILFLDGKPAAAPAAKRGVISAKCHKPAADADAAQYALRPLFTLLPAACRHAFGWLAFTQARSLDYAILGQETGAASPFHFCLSCQPITSHYGAVSLLRFMNSN